MSRSAHQRQQQKLQAQQQQQLLAQQMADNENAAAAAEMFDLFCVATTMRQILGLHRQMCELVGLRPGPLNEFYPKLKTKIRSWKAQALWKKFDGRASHRAYMKGNACTGTRVLVIGAGPCGLRTAIEAQLLGAKVVVLEKRDRISRNNVLHLWPFVITDLRNLGAKKFYGKFCAGSIDHISIRQLQCILLKVALLLGVEIHEGVSFDRTIEPDGEGCGWKAQVSPADHAVSHYEFDVLIGADGKRNTLEGFKRKEFRGKLAIAITANFINKKTEAEAKAEEISGVAFIFNQSFFKELYHTTGIDLENIVYYKDETHYFVMTAKKHSLIDKGVILQDFTDPAELLAPANVNTEKLLDYAREAAEFSTKYQMPNLEFAVNHYGKPDVAMFDFTSMFAAETSCRVIVRHGFRLLQCLVGDSLLEPFWPTGSGCARGFLSSMDAAYAIKLWSNPANSILGVAAQRESIYRLLGQTTPENLQRDIGGYTVDPATRYPNLNRSSVNVWQVKHLVDTDDPTVLEHTFMDTNALQVTQVDTPLRRKRRSGDNVPLGTVLLRWTCAQLHSHSFSRDLKEVSDIFTNGKVLCALINRYRPDLVDFNAMSEMSPAESNELAFKILEKELHIPRVMSGQESIHLNNVDSKAWLNYLEQICEKFRGEIPHVKHPKIDFSELRDKYRSHSAHAQPDFSNLLLHASNLKAKSPMQDAVDVPQVVHKRSVLDEEKLKRQRRHEQLLAGNAASAGHAAQIDTPRRAKKRRNAEKATNIDRERADIQSAYPRTNLDEQFSDRIKSMEQRITSRGNYGADKKPKDLMRAIGKIDSNDWNVREIEKKIEQSKKTEVHGPKGREKVPKWSKEQFQARQHKMAKPTRQTSTEDEKFKEIDHTLKTLDKQLKEGSVLEVGERGRNKVASLAGQFKKREDVSEESIPPVGPKSSSKVALAFKKQAASEKCHFCRQTVYLMEKLQVENLVMHRGCLKCHHCHTNLRLGGYAFDRDNPTGLFYCTQHFRLPAKPTRPVVRKPGQRKPPHGHHQQELHAAAAIAASDTTEKGKHAAVPFVKDGAHMEATESPQTPDKRGPVDSVAKLDLLERGQTPERIEFENAEALSDGEPSEEHIIDEHEWSGRNFLPESNNDSESEISSSNESDAESDSDMFEEANDSPLGAQTLQLASEWIGKQNYSDSDESDEFYDSSEGLPDDDRDDTEGEEFEKARELRREEVRLPPLPPNLPTDTETEVQTDSESSTSDEIEPNSATEISTDSEFDNDELIRSAPRILIDDSHLRKPTKVQVKSTIIHPSAIQKHSHVAAMGQQKAGESYLSKYHHQDAASKTPAPQFKPLVQVDPSVLTCNRTALQNPRPGDYLLNKTASTEGIASKKSLELKKRYLLGEAANGNRIQKSGSTSVLDSRIRSFQSNISECQKLLHPSNDISAGMKTFLDRTKLGENASQDAAIHTATNNILNDLKGEITIRKASSAASTDNEKENVFVNSKNELNKCIEYSEVVNSPSAFESVAGKQSPSTPMNRKSIIETIDLVTPEKQDPHEVMDANKIIDLTGDSPDRSNRSASDDVAKPVKSTDLIQCIPDILGHIEKNADKAACDDKESIPAHDASHFAEEKAEKTDIPEKFLDHFNSEVEDVQIEVPRISWGAQKSSHCSISSNSTCTSQSSSLEDIEHYILESTTSPETNNSAMTVASSSSTGGHQVPRVEVHDTAGTLMQIDSLMIIDGKYVGDPEDLQYMDVPEGIIVPEQPVIKTQEVDDNDFELDHDQDPATVTPEPVEATVIETRVEKRRGDDEPPPLPENGPPLPKTGPPKIKPSNLKFDTKNENKIHSLKNLPLIVDSTSVEKAQAIKPSSLSISSAQTALSSSQTHIFATPTSPIDADKTPTGDSISRGSDSETEPTGTAQILTETELSDWTADDCISENFVDMDFVSNSIRVKSKSKSKQKHPPATRILPSTNEVMQAVANTAPIAEFEGILKSIDLDDIEFMDTGSESSDTEPHSATNVALLRNKGYVEFVEHSGSKHGKSSSSNVAVTNAGTATVAASRAVPMKRDAKLGIDYIEQGAYIMQVDINKTPVNEAAKGVVTPQHASLVAAMSHSLTDSSTANDVEDDSIDSQVHLSSSCTTSATVNADGKAALTTSLTTEDSDALTIVSSPLDSSPPRVPISNDPLDAKAAGYISTPSSSDRAPKTSQSTTSSNSRASSSRPTPPRQLSKEGNNSQVLLAGDRKSSDDISYEEYVRALQQKIVQISTTARGDSIEPKKQRRKISKGDLSHNSALGSSTTESVIEPTMPKHHPADCGTEETASLNPETTASLSSQQPAHQTFKTVPEIATLSRKLEEITKERTKQKDLIHDLVMDKLQSKKQLNAEKRLHRSRQRSIQTQGPGGRAGPSAAGGHSTDYSLSPTPKLAAAVSTSDANCSNQAHYHASTAALDTSPSARTAAATQRFLRNSSSFRDEYSSLYLPKYGDQMGSATSAHDASKQRPISEQMGTQQLKRLEQIYKGNKTPLYGQTAGSHPQPCDSTKDVFAVPQPPVRTRHECAANTNSLNARDLGPSMENLRMEARARARLKSNSELGLSPEEKMQLLRKRIQSEYGCGQNQGKINTSKSVNDLALLSQVPRENTKLKDGSDAPKLPSAKCSFTSDPNIPLSSKNTAGKSIRRAKNPERRKSLIQSLSSFFHMGHHGKEGKPRDGPAVDEGQQELTGKESIGASTSSSSSTSQPLSGIESVLSRLRISPQSKKKSRHHKEECAVGSMHIIDNRSRHLGPLATCLSLSTEDATPTPPPLHSISTPISHHLISSGQGSQLGPRAQRKAHDQYPSISCANKSSSSPQLNEHKRAPHATTSTARALPYDDQTPPPIPPLPLNYQRSDDESLSAETRDQRKQRALSKAARQAELKRLRIAQEIQREQEEIEVQLRELETRGVSIEKALRGEQIVDTTIAVGSSDEKLLRELLEIWRNITQLKKRDEELGIRQQELQLEHRHAQLKEELNMRLSSNRFEKSSADVAAEGAILNEMLEIVAKRAALRPSASTQDSGCGATSSSAGMRIDTPDQSDDINESNI